MVHVRKQIRDFVVGLLTNETSAGTNVFAQRILPIKQGVDKVCLVFALTEPAQVLSMGSISLSRSLALRIEGHYKAAADQIDDLMDEFALAVEKAIAGDKGFGGLIFDVVLTNTIIQHDARGELPVGVIQLDYMVEYHTLESDPESVL